MPAVDAAAAVNNDNYADAVNILATPFSSSRNTAGASTEFAEQTWCSDIGATLWYRYTATTSTTLVIATDGSNFDTVIVVYRGGPETEFHQLYAVGCDNNGGEGTTSRLQIDVWAGGTYYIQAGGYSGATGQLKIGVNALESSSSSPNNDNFASAESVLLTSTQETHGATLETDEPRPCGAIGATVWFTYTALKPGTVTFDTKGSDYDTVLAAYAGSSLGHLSNLACNDDSIDRQSQISFSMLAGETIYVQVGGYVGNTGLLQLNVS